MSGWGGFTDEDLQKVNRQSSNEDGPRVARGGSRGRPGPRRKAPQRSMPSSVAANAQPTDSLPPGQRLAQPKPPTKQNSSQVKTDRNPQKATEVSPQPKSSSKEPQGDHKTATAGTGTGVQRLSMAAGENDPSGGGGGWEAEMKEEETEDMNEEDIVNLELGNLDKFREQQKAMEELNKRKRQMLSNAIIDRQQKARAESTKLSRIQAELVKMDHMLTVDVSLIRDRIEEASREYMEAQKRYDRAEREFIAAKMQSHTAQENKEQLTEHLYTVIHQNEVRKAQKLKELMQKLEMENSGEDSEITELVRHMEIPSLTVLDTMQKKEIAHQTGPKSPPSSEPKSPKLVPKSDQSQQQNQDKNSGNQPDNHTATKPDSDSKDSAVSSSVKDGDTNKTEVVSEKVTKDNTESTMTSQESHIIAASKQDTKVCKKDASESNKDTKVCGKDASESNKDTKETDKDSKEGNKEANHEPSNKDTNETSVISGNTCDSNSTNIVRT